MSSNDLGPEDPVRSASPGANKPIRPTSILLDPLSREDKTAPPNANGGICPSGLALQVLFPEGHVARHLPPSGLALASLKQ